MFNGKKAKNYFDLEKNKNNDNKIVNIKNNISSKKNFSKTKEKLIQYPQVINNYDVNVRVNIKKMNDNKINIENISELINRKLDSSNPKNKKTKYNQIYKDDKKEFFYKTDNNINYLNFINESKNNKFNYIINNINNNLSNINKENEQNGEHYNNMILNLKQEFKQITKGKDSDFNIFNKEKTSENYIKKYLSNTNEHNNLNNNKYFNNTYSDNINKKKYSWNLKSINDKNKKNNINNIYDEIMKEQNKENKIKTQNNFYRISNRHIGGLLNEELSELKLTEKNDEKIKSKDEKIKRNLKKAINFINDKKKSSGEKYNNLNLTDNLNDKLNNNLNNHSRINIKENKNKLNLTSKDNNNILNDYINSSKINCKINNKKINKCNSYIYNKNNLNLNFNFNDTQSFIIEEEENNNINKINKSKIRNNMSYINEQNIILNINKQPYLNKKISKIKKKIIGEMKNENINNSNFNIYEIVKNISFSLINRNNNNIIIDNLEKKSLYFVNKILKIQNNIILEIKRKELILKNELIKKSKEIINLKNICMKLMWYITSNKDFNFNENKKKKYLIQNQIIKENRLLRKLFINNKNISNISINEIKRNNPIYRKLKEKNSNNNCNNAINKETMITLENNRFNREKEYFNIYDKKRNKSYERVNEKNKRKNNGIDIFKNNEILFNYTDYIQKRNKNSLDRDNNSSLRTGKKIKYLVKEKYSY